ncbi:DUF1330 domain-containing protein [Pontivivens insulae]|nr:DUF1330 domain-containing protein [Pontivivens insulae]
MTTPYIDPTREQFGAFAKLPQDTPISMLNLVKLRDAAAYRRYSKETAPILARVGGHVEWSGQFEAVLIGPDQESWDVVFIARYPNAAAFIEMIRDPDYQRAVTHRQHAVETSRLIRLAPREAGNGFG